MDRSGTTNTCQDPTGTSGVAQCRGNSTALHSCDSDVTATQRLVLDKGFIACSLKGVGTIFSFRTGSKVSCGKNANSHSVKPEISRTVF